MKRLVFALTVALAASFLGCTQATRISSLSIPDETVKEVSPVDVAAYIAKYPNYDGVMLDVEETIEHSGVREGLFKELTEWSYSRVYREKYIVLNTEADWLTTYEVGYKPDKLYMTTISPAGQMSHFGSTNLEKVVDKKGYDRYKFAFPRVEKGTVIEIGWEESYSVSRFLPPLYHDIALQFRIPCEHIKFTYGYPEWWHVNVKRLSNTRDIVVRYDENKDAKKVMLVYEAHDTPALRYEPYSPPFRQVATYLQFMVTDMEMKGFAFSPASSWEKVAEEFRKYAIKKAGKKPKEVSHVTDSLVAGVDSKLSQLQRIVAFVSSHIDPEGFGNNGDPGKTLSAAKGNSYDMTGLTQTMLDRVGLNSDFLLVHSSEDGWFDPAFISPRQLYIPALHVRIDTTDYLAFPWLKNFPVTQIPEPYRGEFALYISEEDAGKNWITLKGNDQINGLDQMVDVSIDSTGSITARHRTTYHGTSAYGIRRILDDLNRGERRKLADSLIHLSGADIVLDTFDFIGDTTYYEPLTTVFDYHLGNLVTKTPDEIIVRTSDLLSPATGSERPDSLERQNPILIERPEIMTKQVTITYPTSWTLTTVLEPSRIENQFGLLECTYEMEPGKIVCSQHLALKEISAPKEQSADLVTLLGAGAKGSAPALVFKRP